MTLTPEQARQCRNEFNEWWNKQWRNSETYDDKWEGFQAAWRPRLTVKQIMEAGPVSQENAIAIHRAQGGQE